MPRNDVAMIRFSRHKAIFSEMSQPRVLIPSQGWQSPFVILDYVTPRGPDFLLGFLKDENRLNIALSRAQDGLIIVGSKSMTDGLALSNQVKAWKQLIQYTSDLGAVCSTT